MLFATLQCTSCVICSQIAYVGDSVQEVGVVREGISNALKEGWKNASNASQHQNIACNV
jgi:hypothetical protein